MNMGISLWLVPTAAQTAKLKRAMGIRHSPTRSPASFPDFHPHVTLASGSPAALRAAIPPDQAALRCAFAAVDVGDRCFMSVYARVFDAGALAALRAHLRERLGECAVPPVPHVSLYYIDDADTEERAQVREELERSGRIVQRVDGVSLDCSEDPTGGDEDVLDGIDGEAIWIAKCDGPVSGWEVLEKIHLK